MNLLKLSALQNATVTGSIEHGGITIEFPIAIERMMTHADDWKSIVEDEKPLHVQLADIGAETSQLVAVATFTQNPNKITEFLSRVQALTTSPESGEAPDSEAVQRLLGGADELAEMLLPDEGEMKAREERDGKRLDELNAEVDVIEVDLHRMRARRIAFWCPDWKVENDAGETVPMSADILEAFSPELLGKIEFEMSVKAPGRIRAD